VLIAAACAAPVRFTVRAPVWRDRDDAPIATPKPRDTLVEWPAIRQTVFLPLDRVLGLDYAEEAMDVNSFDELPDSSWYADPRRDPARPDAPPAALGAERLRWGAASPDDVPQPPYRVVKGKSVGATPGFVIEDARKVRYLLKLDGKERPGLATSTEVVVSRLAWACGWRVPAEVMFAFRREDLTLSPRATVKDRWDRAQPFEVARLDAVLAGAAARPDGSYAALASRWLTGVNLGPFTFDGTRPDDPNDVIPHQHRRSLRGFGVFAAWVNDVDTLENNTLDMYVGPPGRGHVLHYQQDVGGSFGVFAAQVSPYWMGHETYLDPLPVFRSLLTLGVWPRPWATESFRRNHDVRVAAWPELGGFGVEGFAPRSWRPTVDNPAFSRLTRRDRYWAAKRLAAFTEDELRGAIAAGWYRPAAAERLLTILLERRRPILDAYFGDVSALDHFRFSGARLCFDDLWVAAGLGGATRTRAFEGKLRLEIEQVGPHALCAVLPPRFGERIVSLEVARASRPTPAPVRVHIAETAGERRIIGIER
jgi:hypothetical protein